MTAMNESYLNALFCPYCGFPLKLHDVFEEKEGEIRYAITNCECARYPIAEGILVLDKGHSLQRIIESFEKKKFSEALNILVEIKPYTETFRVFSRLEKTNMSLIRNIALSYKKMVNKPLLVDSKLSFFETIDALDWGGFGDYVKTRFSHPDFMGNRALIQILMNNERAKKPALDLGCGVGHNSFILSHYVQQNKITCADLLFVNLLITKRFFVKNANFICLDANTCLPFENNSFSTIICFDVFYGLAAKRLLANELKRITSSDGALLLSGLPNSLKTGPTYWHGAAMTPDAYSRLFDDTNLRLLGHRRMLTDFLTKDKVTLDEKYPDSELNNSERLFLLATRNKEDLRAYSNLGRKIFEKIRKTLIINPVYTIQEKGNDFYLHKTISFLPYMKKNYIIKREMLELIKEENIASNQLDELYKLWKGFILIDAPKNFTRQH